MKSNPINKIAILLLEQIPQVHHLASIALELSFLHGLEVSVIGNPGSIQVFRQIAELYPEHQCEIVLEKSKGFRRISEWIRRRKTPRTKSILDRNLKALLQFDMIVSSDFYTSWTIPHRTGKKPLFVFGFHGAGDHAYGFQQELKDYDYLLISGPKIEDRLREEGILRNSNGLLIGYPKFDNTLKQPKQSFFDNDLPVVVYNPHFNQELSSYYKWGENVLEFFYNSKEYNLIFAPHFNLFNKQKNHVIPAIPKKYMDAKNILFDFGSLRSIDMTYTMNADLYLGDVSSQVYEFLYHLKPCMFLNSQKSDWQENPNYKHWDFGPVLNDIADFEIVLTQAFANHESFKEVQQIGFNETFSRTKESAGKRAAIALSRILNEDHEA
jgi:hypothetical protein